MKTIYPILIGACALSWSTAAAQSAAETQLLEAREELKSTRAEYTQLRNALYREINELDDRALELGRELRDLEHEEKIRTTRQAALKRDIQGLQSVFDYGVGVLNNYSGAFQSRIHPAENQLYQDRVTTAVSEAGATDEPAGELGHYLKVAEVGLDRLESVIGGYTFEGKGLRNGSEAIEGDMLALGPAVFMSAKNGSFEGVATFTSTGTELPTVVGLASAEKGIIQETLASGKGPLPLDASMGKAIEVEAASESLAETIAKGGIVGYAILVLGGIALAMVLFKVYEIIRFPVPSRRRINELLDDLLVGKHDEAKAKAANLPGLAGKVMQAAVDQFYEKRRVLEESIFEKLVLIRPRLERFLPFLGLTAAASPLMGLLGTVLGIIKTFKAMALYGSSNKSAFTQGISEALITTAMGLVVAIPVLVLHGMLKSLAKGKFSEVEAASIAMVNGTTEMDKGKVLASMESDDAEDDTDGEAPDDDAELAPNPA